MMILKDARLSETWGDIFQEGQNRPGEQVHACRCCEVGRGRKNVSIKGMF